MKIEFKCGKLKKELKRLGVFEKINIDSKDDKYSDPDSALSIFFENDNFFKQKNQNFLIYWDEDFLVVDVFPKNMDDEELETENLIFSKIEINLEYKEKGYEGARNAIVEGIEAYVESIIKQHLSIEQIKQKLKDLN